MNEFNEVNVIVPLEFFFQVPFPAMVTSFEQEEVSAGLIRQMVVVKVEVTVGDKVTGFDVEVVPVSAVMVGAAGGLTVTEIVPLSLAPKASVTRSEMVAEPVKPSSDLNVTVLLELTVQL